MTLVRNGLNSESAPDLGSDFDYAAGKLFQGLRELHESTGPEIGFNALAKSINERLQESDLPADLVDQYVRDQVQSDKLGHFVETALAFAFRAAQLHDRDDRLAWLYLCQAYFAGGMATLQFNLARGPQLRVQPYNAIKNAIMYLVELRCPPEKWASLEEMWRAIEDDVMAANDLLEGMPGFSKDPKAAFERLARSKRKDFLPFLSGPVKRGRPSKKRPRA